MSKDGKHRNWNIMNNEVAIRLQNGGPYETPPKILNSTDDPKEKLKTIIRVANEDRG
jgi:hypothetical protein